jgi:hypothetical protein
MKATAVGVAAAVRSPAVKSAAVRVPAASVGSVPAMRRGRGTRCAGDNAGYNQENAFEEGRLPHLIPPSNLRTGLGVQVRPIPATEARPLRAVVKLQHISRRKVVTITC